MNNGPAILHGRIMRALRQDAVAGMEAVNVDRVWASKSRPGVAFVPTRFGEVRVRYMDSHRSCRTIVLTVDGPNSIEHYDELFTALGEAFNVIVLEPLGYGFSTPDKAFHFTIEHYAEALHEVLDILGIHTFIFAPSCSGVYPAIRFCERWPGRVTHAILIQAAGWSEQLKWVERIDPIGILRKPEAGQRYARQHIVELARTWYSIAFNEVNRERFISVARQCFARGMRFYLASQIQGMFVLPRPAWQPLRAAAAILWGAQDRSHSKTDKQSALELVAEATVHIWPDAGHSPQLEHPVRFASLVHQLVHG